MFITSVDPYVVAFGGISVTLKVRGTGFPQNALIRLGGQLLKTTYVSATELTADVPGVLLQHTGTLSVEVTHRNRRGATEASIPWFVPRQVSRRRAGPLRSVVVLRLRPGLQENASQLGREVSRGCTLNHALDRPEARRPGRQRPGLRVVRACSRGLERIPQAELGLTAGRPGPRDAAGVRVHRAVDEGGHVGRAEVGPVEEVERLDPELELSDTDARTP